MEYRSKNGFDNELFVIVLMECFNNQSLFKIITSIDNKKETEQTQKVEKTIEPAHLTNINVR